jgi:hypothetical protein
MDHGIQARAFIPSYDQRIEMTLVSRRDLQLAEKIGAFAVEQLTDDKSQFLCGIRKTSDDVEIEPCRIDFAEINGFSRIMPERWIQPGKFDVSNAYLHYLSHLFGKEPFIADKYNARNYIVPANVLFPNVENDLRK